MHKSDIQSYLKSSGLKITPNRLKILSVFANSKIPLSAEDTIKKISKSGINDVTVYRTLQSFEESKILKRVNIRSNSVCYEIASDHHHHIICNKCGEIEDFNVCVIDDVLVKVMKKSKKFKNIDDHSIDLFGVCNLCSKK